MSMPFFDYVFHCTSCDISSDRYSLYPFPALFESDIRLPTWSVKHKFWGHCGAGLSLEQRATLEGDSDELIAFARSISSEHYVVGVPVWIGSGADRKLTITPEPQCPYCGQLCEVMAFPDGRREPGSVDFTFDSVEDFRVVPIARVELSVRTLALLRRRNIVTLGELEDKRNSLSEDDKCSDSVLREIDELLAHKPDKERLN